MVLAITRPNKGVFFFFLAPDVMATTAVSSITTPRLLLRPFARSDTAAIASHCGDLRVARMCRVVPHPYGIAEAEFFVDQVCSRADGRIYAIVLGGHVVGCVGLESISGESATLGYWSLASLAARRGRETSHALAPLA